jgi:inner membrane protein
MGYVMYRATAKPTVTQQRKLVTLYLFAANAPDLDFLPGLFTGDLGQFHHGPSHSIAFAVVFGILAAVVFPQRIYAFAVGLSLYLSHVLLDYLVQDPSPPFGVLLFWPFSKQYYMAPFAFYRSFDYPNSFSEPIISTFLTFHNFLTLLTEVLFLLPVLIFVSWYERSTFGTNKVEDIAAMSR